MSSEEQWLKLNPKSAPQPGSRIQCEVCQIGYSQANLNDRVYNAPGNILAELAIKRHQESSGFQGPREFLKLFGSVDSYRLDSDFLHLCGNCKNQTGEPEWLNLYLENNPQPCCSAFCEDCQVGSIIHQLMLWQS